MSEAKAPPKYQKLAKHSTGARAPHAFFIWLHHALPYIAISFFFITATLLVADHPIGHLFLDLHYRVGTPEEKEADGIIDTNMEYHIRIRSSHPDWNFYGRGRKDAYTMVSCIFFWILFHRFLQEFILDNFARHLGICGFKITKFKEAGYFAIFYIFSFSFGWWLTKDSPWVSLSWDNPFVFDFYNIWTQYPFNAYAGIFKLYYLLTTANWFAQIFILLTEDRRNDFWQYMIHHFITINLTGWSYAGGWLTIGSAVMVCFDFADLFLYFGKCILYYAESLSGIGEEYPHVRRRLRREIGPSYDPHDPPKNFWHKVADFELYTFGLAWIYTRHFVFGKMIYSQFYDSPRLIPCYPSWGEIPGCYYNRTSYIAYACLFAGLQIVCLIWLKEIIRLATSNDKVVRDTRSDEDIPTSDQNGSEKKTQ